MNNTSIQWDSRSVLEYKKISQDWSTSTSQRKEGYESAQRRVWDSKDIICREKRKIWE